MLDVVTYSASGAACPRGGHLGCCVVAVIVVVVKAIRWK